MNQNTYCPIIHGGLHIVYSAELDEFKIQSCCLRRDYAPVEQKNSIWTNSNLIQLREMNRKNVWDQGCFNCYSLEQSGQPSFRTGMLDKFGIRENLTGPQRIDLMFDRSCNLACRTCGPNNSTFWQQHLYKNNLVSIQPKYYDSAADKVIDFLNSIDLTNLKMLVFCGGETLMGNNYWKIANYLAEKIPHAKTQLTISFQTNGTQQIPEKYFELIEKFHLVKLHISLDAVADRFNYLRWPASWEQVVDNIKHFNRTLPVNVMFLIEETISIFNLYYQHELDQWVKDNFAINRLGDRVDHTRHLAENTFSLDNLTKKYIESLDSNLINFVSPNFNENANNIKQMIKKINQFDQIRNEDWRKTFPEVADFYSDYLR